MLRNTALATLLLAGFAGLSGCRQIEKLTGAPHRLDDAEAAARYLDITCPANLRLRRLNQEFDNKLYLYNSGKLTDVEWGKYLDSNLLAMASNKFLSAKAKTDPRFTWPEPVRASVSEMAAAEMEMVADDREFVRQGGYTAASKEPGPWPERPKSEAIQRYADMASKIRTILHLPPRSEGCKSGKRSLTLEQIKKLQGG